MVELKVSGLRIYPIKSLGGIELTESQIEKRGLRNDRRWMLVGSDGVFLTQRSDSRLALFRTALSDSGLEVSYPGRGTISVPTEPVGYPRQVTVWKSECDAIQVSAELDSWFSDILQLECSLVHMPNSTVRETNLEYTQPGDIVGFADAFPILIAGEESLAELNRRLEEPLPMNRFRPNVIVRGAQPFAEDTWTRIRVAELPLRAAKTCARCAVTATNQDTGEVGVEPLRTLASFRRQNQLVYFGAYFVPEDERPIKIGDSIRVESCTGSLNLVEI